MYCREADGVEFDWFAQDLDGHLALFTSGGSAQVPPIMATLVDAIEALQRDIGVGYQSLDADSAARAGFYVYDVNINGGPYRRIGTPRAPKTVDQLPAPHRELVARAIVQGRFADLRKIACELIRC